MKETDSEFEIYNLFYDLNGTKYQFNDREGFLNWWDKMPAKQRKERFTEATYESLKNAAKNLRKSENSR